jgi:hypothetical protein
LGDFLRDALPGHVHRGALSGPPVVRCPGRSHTSLAPPSSTRSFARSAQFNEAQFHRASARQRFRRWFSQAPGRIPWGESAPGHGKAPCTPARGGTVGRAPSSPLFQGSVRLRGAKVGVESPTVLDPAGLRALDLSTPTRPFGSLPDVRRGGVERARSCCGPEVCSGAVLRSCCCGAAPLPLGTPGTAAFRGAGLCQMCGSAARARPAPTGPAANELRGPSGAVSDPRPG